jgi:hypothetical protein
VTDEEIAVLVAAAVAVVLGYQGAVPARVVEASAAAVAVARWFLHGPEELPTLLPDGPDAMAGYQSLAVRIYHDPASPGGVVGGDAYTGAAIPEDLLAHVRHYFAPYRTSFGFA